MKQRKLDIDGPGTIDGVPYLIFSEAVSNLEGQILTLIEAGIVDSIQRSAMKDLTRRTLWRWVSESNRVNGFDIYHKELDELGE